MSDFVKQEEGIVPQQNISNNLSVLVDIGMRTEQEQSAALRAIQLGVASSACTNIATMHSVSERALAMANRLHEEYLAKLEEELPTMTRTDLSRERDSLMAIAKEVTTLEVKMIQGKPLFPEDSISAEDRRALRLLSNLKDPEQKRRLLEFAESLNPETFDTPEVDIEETDMQSDGAYGSDVSLAGQEVPAPSVVSDVEDAHVVSEVLQPDAPDSEVAQPEAVQPEAAQPEAAQPEVAHMPTPSGMEFEEADTFSRPGHAATFADEFEGM